MDYRALQQQFSVVIEQLNAARAETSTLREQADASQKSRQEVLLVRDQTDAGSTALLRFEVDFQKREVLRLMQALEDLHREREASRKDSVQVCGFADDTIYNSIINQSCLKLQLLPVASNRSPRDRITTEPHPIAHSGNNFSARITYGKRVADREATHRSATVHRQSL